LHESSRISLGPAAWFKVPSGAADQKRILIRSAFTPHSLMSEGESASHTILRLTRILRQLNIDRPKSAVQVGEMGNAKKLGDTASAYRPYRTLQV
jgi:hypothetical protein